MSIEAAPAHSVFEEGRPFPERGDRRSDLTAAVVEFYGDESAALDEGRYGEWLDMLTDGFIYQVPVMLVNENPDLPRFSEQAMLFEATKQIFEMRLCRVDRAYAWADRPSATTRHFVSGVRVFETTDRDRFRVESNVLASWQRGRAESALITAGRQDVLARGDDGLYAVARRRVVLDTEVPTHTELSIIF